MASTLTRNLLHITFSTKRRANMIPPAIESELFAFVGGICRNHKCTLLSAGGTADHVHLLIDLSKTLALATLLLNVKRDSSRWIKERGRTFAAFDWQDGYFAFSIGQSAIASLCEYIANQKEHHRSIGYVDEVRQFLTTYEIAFDERYVWD